jgi:hypothetical protein
MQNGANKEAEDDMPLSELRQKILQAEADDVMTLHQLQKKLQEEGEDEMPLDQLQKKLQEEGEDEMPLDQLQKKLQEEAEDEAPLSVLEFNLQRAHRTLQILCGAAKQSPTLIKGGIYLCPPFHESGNPDEPDDKYPFYLIQLAYAHCFECDNVDGQPQIRCHYLEPAQPNWSDEDKSSGGGFTTLREWLTTPWQIAGPGHYRCLQFVPKALIKQELIMEEAGAKKWTIIKTSFYDRALYETQHPIRAAIGGRAPGGVPEAAGWGAYYGRQKNLFNK